MINILKKLIDDEVLFVTGKSFIDLDETQIFSCVSNSCQKGTVCNEKCQLILPKINLVNKINNEEFYLNRMEDELIRYNHIKMFIFKPQKYLSFGNVKYNLREDEIILLHENITQEYFEQLVPAEINQYAKYNTYDTANPIKTSVYDNRATNIHKVVDADVDANADANMVVDKDADAKKPESPAQKKTKANNQAKTKKIRIKE